MLEAGDSIDDILRGYAWLHREDVLACIAYARRLVGHERVELAHDNWHTMIDALGSFG